MLTNKGELVSSSSYPFPKMKIVGTLSNPICTTIFNKAGKNIDETVALLKSGKSQSFATEFNLKAAFESTYVDFNTFNVAGKIEGTDAKLKKQYVVHSAHLDHIGIGAVVEGDSIYNGAHDNASGVASLLQITKIYQNLKVKPKRSILILMVTGEEMGLLGSSYFAIKPTVPVKNIVANVNTDMPAIIAPLLSVAPLGADHSTLINPVTEAATHLGLTVEPDPEPKENRFVRSDQYSFIKQGIPALHIKYGNKTADGKNNLNLFVEKWRAKYYHKPQDDINGIFDFEAGRKYAQLNFLIGYLVANDLQKPSWNPGDIFEKK
jgi:Zn-dependent M28 family amino/carboxypeptidase